MDSRTVDLLPVQPTSVMYSTPTIITRVPSQQPCYVLPPYQFLIKSSPLPSPQFLNKLPVWTPINSLAAPQTLHFAQNRVPPVSLPSAYTLKPPPTLTPHVIPPPTSKLPPTILMAQMMNSQTNEQSKTPGVSKTPGGSKTAGGSKNNSSNSKYFQEWISQPEESLQMQNGIFHKASFGHILFCCFTLDSEWFICLEEIGLPVKAWRHELQNCLTCEDLDCMLLIEDIFTIIIRLTKSDSYLVKMLDAVKKIEVAMLKETDILVDYLLEKAHPHQIVQQTWNEVFLQSDASKQQKQILTLFLMKLYQQHVKDFDVAIDSWEKIRNLSLQDTYEVADTLQEKGEEQLKNGNLEDALGYFNDAILNCPLDVHSYKQRAKIHEMLKNYKLCSCDLIRVHVLEPEWEEGYAIHHGILKNLDEQWTTYCFKLIDKWKVGVHCFYAIKTIDKDAPEEDIDCVSPLETEEKKKEEKMSSARNGFDKLIQKAMNLYKQQNYKEMLQLFKANILETTFYQIALLSLIHLKRLDHARRLASTAIQTFTDTRQFSGDEKEVKNLKKMFNFIKSLPPTPFGECEMCKTAQQSNATSIYIYNDFSVLDDIFHKGCVVLQCENRCKILFHFECLSGSNDFIWTESSLKNYLKTICSTADCQSGIIVVEAFFVDDTKPIKVVDDSLTFKRPEIENFTEISDTNLSAQSPEEHNSNTNASLTSSDEAILPSDNSESSTQDSTPSSVQAQAAALNDRGDIKSPPSYKAYERKKSGKNKKRRSEKKCPLPDSELTEASQLEVIERNLLEQSSSDSSEDIEKENLLLYLLSVLHDHGPQSESGKIFQNEIKALKEDHKKLIFQSGGLASFLLQSNNVLARDPDILYLNPDTLTTVIPDSDHFPLQQIDPTSATSENFASNVYLPSPVLEEMSASSSYSRKECVSPTRNEFEVFVDALNQDASKRKPNNASGYTDDEPSSNLADGSPKLDSLDEGLKTRSLPPDKKEETNILDQSSSEFEYSSSSSSSRISEREKESEEEDNDFFYSEEGSVDSFDSTESDLQTCETCQEFKQRLVFLEQAKSMQYHDERRKAEIAEQRISALEAQVESLEKENRYLRREREGIPFSEGMEASNYVCPKSILRHGRRSLPSHMKSSPNMGGFLLAEEEETNSNLCVICHDALLLRNVNTTLQCGHTFHDNCIRKWFEQQKTCPNCRKHTLLAEEFPPLS